MTETSCTCCDTRTAASVTGYECPRCGHLPKAHGARRCARVPAELSRDGWQRTAGHVATAGQVTGRGTSGAAALADLAGALEAMASRAYAGPAFWWDAANRQLHVVTPDPVSGGHFAYIVRMTDAGPVQSQCTSSGVAPAGEALSTAVGMARVPTER